MNRIEIIKHLVNNLAVVLMSAIAFLFIAYGLAYKSINFIEINFNILFAVAGVGFTALMVAGIIFYAFSFKTVYRLIVCLLIFFDICAVVFFALCATGFISKINSVDALREYISQSGAWAALIYIVFSFLQVVLLPVPGSVAVAVGVAMFGPLRCAIYSFLGIVAGSIAAFAIGRWIGYKAVCWIVGKESLDKWLKKLKGKDYLILSLMFLLPLFPDDILCFVAGLSSMTWGFFLVMIIVTRAISVFSTAYSLELIPFTTWWGILVWMIILTLVILAFYLVCKYYEKIDNFIKTNFKFNKKKR
ncbi:MAG: VTT domain-containing protein [Clostridia bacterium]|nr:VTT domain-containing protein [Clostridia bacterium]